MDFAIARRTLHWLIETLGLHMASVDQQPLAVFVNQAGNATFAAIPAASVAGFYLAHPEARYFAITKIDRDQLEDWA